MAMDLKKLQNGSDIRGVAAPGVPDEPVTLTPESAFLLTKGFACWLEKNCSRPISELKISVGHDSRITADTLKKAVCDGLVAMGCTVLDCGLASTPSMFMSTVFPELACDGAIMITASHLPFNRNGLKFFNRNGGLDKPDIAKVIELAGQNITGTGSGKIEKAPLIDIYSRHLVELIRKGANRTDDYDRPLKGLKIIVDAGNGAGGFFVEKVLKPLGADTTGSQFLEPDGMFPNHIPNPENKEAMKSVCSAVLKNNADLGIIFDTDVDRSSAVDRYGKEISRNAIIALISAIIAQQHPGTAIVTDSVTSDELTEFIEHDLNCRHHRFKRGYKNVINEAIRLNQSGEDCQLAIETSGHAALKENYFLDDGAYLTAKLLIKAAQMAVEGKSLDMLIAGLRHPLEACEIRLKITASDFKAYGTKMLEDFKAFAEGQKEYQIAPVNHEGVRVNLDQQNGNGWMLVRLSLHDPIIPVNIESNSAGGCKQIAAKLIDFLRPYQEIDVTSLEQFLEN